MVDLLGDDGLMDLRRRRPASDVAGAVQDLRQRGPALPERNEALRAWTPQARRHDGCHLCGKAPRMQCQACHRPACGADSWVMLGLCRTCATEERMKLWHDRDRNVSENWLDGP